MCRRTYIWRIIFGVQHDYHLDSIDGYISPDIVELPPLIPVLSLGRYSVFLVLLPYWTSPSNALLVPMP